MLISIEIKGFKKKKHKKNLFSCLKKLLIYKVLNHLLT